MSKKLKFQSEETQALLHKVIRFALVFFLVVYPFCCSFSGIDVGDTGIHYTNFKYLYSRTDIVGYSTVFTSIVGNIWLRFFDKLGLWGLNLLEVFVEWGISFLIYKWVGKFLGNIQTLIGLCLASMAAGTYLNVFNYHQFSVLLIATTMFFVYKGCTEDKLIYTVFSACFCVFAIFARVSSLVCISIYIVYLFYEGDAKFKFCLKHLSAAFCTGVGLSATMVLYLRQTRILGAFLNSVFRLKGMATTSSSLYSVKNIIQNFIFANIKTLASAGLVLAAGFFFLLMINYIRKRKLLMIIMAAVFGCISIVLARFSYDVNPVGSSPQFSTGPNFFMGVLLASGIGYAIYLIRKEMSFERVLLVIMSLLLPLYTVFGSNTGTKHVIISTWMLFPIFIFCLSESLRAIRKSDAMLYGFKSVDVAIAVIFMTVVVFGKFAHLISVTNNFDATDRRLIIASVDAPKTKYLQTTTREAESLNGLYHAYAANSGENDNKLVVFGTGMGLYLILDTEPFTRAWVTDTSMSKEDFSLALNDENVSSLPYIVYCRTNQYFGYDESGYDALIDMVKKNTFYGKKEVLEEYIISKNYGIAYADDYYVLFMQTGSPVDAESLSSYFW